MNNVKKSFFAGDGICGGNPLMPVNSVTIKPSEFDFMNVLTVDPDTNSGKIVYEGDTNNGFVKMNQVLYSGFTTPQSFPLKNNTESLFDMEWSTANQEYTFSNLTGSTTDIEEWVTSYYSNIEFLDIRESCYKNILILWFVDYHSIGPKQKSEQLYNKLILL